MPPHQVSAGIVPPLRAGRPSAGAARTGAVEPPLGSAEQGRVDAHTIADYLLRMARAGQVRPLSDLLTDESDAGGAFDGVP